MLSGVSLLALSNVNNPVGLVGLPYAMQSAHFFVTHIQTEKISSWNGPTVHVCCFMLARLSTKHSLHEYIFVSRVQKTAKKSSLAEKFDSRVTRQPRCHLSIYIHKYIYTYIHTYIHTHTHIQTEKISSWNGPTVHVCCFMLARASTNIFVS